MVAVSDNDVIGRDNALPWHLPADLAYFKRVTMGKPVLMGRRTWDSIGKPLPGRQNLVLTRRELGVPGVERVGSIEEAIQRAGGAEEMMVIGGADVFRMAMPRIDRIHLTRVHCTIDGDVFMPPIDRSEWREVRREEHPADARHACAMTFIELERIR